MGRGVDASTERRARDIMDGPSEAGGWSSPPTPSADSINSKVWRRAARRSGEEKVDAGVVGMEE